MGARTAALPEAAAAPLTTGAGTVQASEGRSPSGDASESPAAAHSCTEAAPEPVDST